MQKRVETKKCDENIHEGGAEKVVKDKSGEEEGGKRGRRRLWGVVKEESKGCGGGESGGWRLCG